MKERPPHQYNSWSLSDKDMRRLRDEGIEISQNEEYYIVQTGDKERFVPRKEHVFIAGRQIHIGRLIRAMARYPQDTPEDALERYAQEEQE
jgi:hypothetical protein